MGSIVDTHGRPMTVQASSYGGQDRFSPELARWTPMLRAPDDAVLDTWETDVGRLRDLTQTNGFASGAVQTMIDQIVGSDLKLVAKPDWRALGLSKEWASDWERQTEAAWRGWAKDLEKRCHASESLDFTGMVNQGQRGYFVTGEIMATLEWINRPAWPYRTAIQPIDPERVSNPYGTLDTPRMRAGIEKNRFGAPIAAHIREAHPHDWTDRANTFRWKRVSYHTEWGRRLFIHIFDQQRPSQTRGQTGFLSGIKQVKMLERWQQTSLQAAIINAMYAAVIESSMDHPAVIEALVGQGENPLAAYLGDALEFHKGTNKIQWDGSKIAHLFPGEKLSMMSAEHPVAAFEQFESAALRNLAASWNMSYEQLSRDYSKTNYSSARASMLEAWKYIISRRHLIAGQYASQIYAAWLEDAIDAGQIELPQGAPDFYAPLAKRAYCQCQWIGPAREHIDPLKGAKAEEAYYQLHATTLEEICAERGKDWEEVVEQRAHERRVLEEAGLSADDAMGIVRRNVAVDEDKETETDDD